MYDFLFQRDDAERLDVMQRWLLSVAVLLTGGVSVSNADYIIIRYIINQPGSDQPGVGVMGNALGQMGIRPGGIGGMPMGAIGVGGNAGVGGMPMGAIGIGANPRGIMGAIGMGGVQFMGAGGNGGMLGVGGNAGFMGNGGNQGFMGNGGNPMGFMGGPNGNQGGGAFTLQPSDYVSAIVELKNAKATFVKGVGTVEYINHKWGSTALYSDNDIQVQPVPKNLVPPPLDQFKREHAALVIAKDRSPDRYLALAETCLQIGLPDKCIEVMNELDKMISEGKSKKENPQRVGLALTAYRKIKPIIADEVTKSERGKAWKTKLGYASMPIGKHYALVHNSDDPNRDGVQRRLDDLENNFKTFYLLFAIKGKALPAPTEKLVAILTDKPDTFIKQRKIFDVGDLSSDGFYARQENLAVFSSSRIDSASINFEDTMRRVNQKNNIDLLSGKFPDLGNRKEEIYARIDEVKRAQMLTLLEHALREESEIAAATHEGTLQLLAETGVLPRNSNAPEWLRFGLASLFEMPKGPFPGKSQAMIRQAFYAGAGGPSWAWRRYLDEMAADGVLPQQPTKEFLDTVTDVYFAHARESAKILPKDLEPAKGPNGMAMPMFNPMGGPMGDHKNEVVDGPTALARARCMSWAVTYYLFTERFEDLQNYLAAIAEMPRDVELDAYSLTSAFGKAFNVRLEGISPAKPNPKVEGFLEISKDWLACLRKYPAPTVSLRLEEPIQSKNPMGGPMPNP